MENDVHHESHAKVYIVLSIVVIVCVAIVSIIVKHVTQTTSTTTTRAAASEVINAVGTLHKMETCIEESICYYVITPERNMYMLSNRKFGSSIRHDASSDYTTYDFDSFVDKTVRIKGFSKSGTTPHVVLTDIDPI